jgi:hypothetical protein
MIAVAIAQVSPPKTARRAGPAVGERLVLANARSALLQRDLAADGSPRCTLFVQDQEIVWDDPRHFGLADQLASGTPFTGQDLAATSGMPWRQVRPMLRALMRAGLVQPADGAAPHQRHDNQPMPSPLPPAPMTTPRAWTDADCLMQHLTGTRLDPYWLEAVVPVFRTAHIFQDRDGRHIGEANAFPAAARTAVPTEWRGCPYAGNRYQPDRPMNMSALRAMRAHWRGMMGLLLQVRAAYLARFPEARQGWTLAHVEQLTVCILALPSHLLLNRVNPIANGSLHPALSNLFRVTDGVRMTVHHMLFVPRFEPMHGPDAPISAETLLAYAERNFLFHSETGVCAGPRFMVEDMLAALLDGTPPRSGLEADPDPELVAAASQIEAAIDHALLGLQSFGAAFALWPATARCYAELHDLLSGPDAAGLAGAAALAKRFAGHFAALSHRSFLASEAWRQHRETVYDRIFANCRHGMGEAPGPSLSQQLATSAPDAGSAHAMLAAAVAPHLGGGAAELAGAFADCVMTFLTRARTVLGLASNSQARLAALLGRQPPSHALSLDHVNLYNRLMGEDQRSVPFLPAELGQLLGLRIHVDAQHISIARGPGRTPHHSPAEQPADPRA